MPFAALDGLSPKKSTFGLQVEAQRLLLPTLTKTDEQFAEQGIVFMEGHEGVNLEELNDLFEQVGFPRRDPDKLKLALEKTHTVIWIRHAKKSRWAKLNQLLGFGRAMSDGSISASIWDVAVLPAWQRSGLGRALLERLLVRLRQDHIDTISLYAEPSVVKLYEKLGFVTDPQGIRGMAFQRKSAIGMKVAAGEKRASVAKG
ncbi:unnamed protein product [Ostreobium quekettii]|uniref:N-acetyltransferase domain-containing protein n=1 Tax=Ostreobium quekettii TaxID=121088 RepID=A0A8S1IP58_9CHLO|nr:unnamed protein product [Ostreobium quekettii]